MMLEMNAFKKWRLQSIDWKKTIENCPDWFNMNKLVGMEEQFWSDNHNTVIKLF